MKLTCSQLARIEGQKNSCVPHALAVATQLPFETTNKWLKQNGYRKNDRVGTATYRFMNNNHGSLTSLKIDDKIYTFESRADLTRGTLSNFSQLHGAFIIGTSKHWIGVCNGVLFDTTIKMRRRINRVWKLTSIENTSELKSQIYKPKQKTIMNNLLKGVSLTEAKVEAAKVSRVKGYVSIMEHDGDFDLELGRNADAYLLFNNGTKVVDEPTTTKIIAKAKKAEDFESSRNAKVVKQVKKKSIVAIIDDPENDGPEDDAPIEIPELEPEMKTKKIKKQSKTEIMKKPEAKSTSKKIVAKATMKPATKTATKSTAKSTNKPVSKKKKPIKWIIDMVKEKATTLDAIYQKFIKMEYEPKTATRQLSIVRAHDEFIVKGDVVKWKK